jgi:hypothetical protein
VSVTLEAAGGGSSYSTRWTVTFLNNADNMSLLTVGCDALNGPGARAGVYRKQAAGTPLFTSGSVGIYERALGVQNIIANATATDLHGYFYVVNSGETSLAIDVYSSAAEVEYILC